MIFFISLALLLIIFNYTVRKLLGVGRKKPFSYHHMNQKHKKLDWSVRIVFIIIAVFIHLSTENNTEFDTPWYFQIWFITVIFLIVSELLRAFMEWKYAENRKAFLATILELLLVISIIILTITTNFFGIF
ncbi:MAG: DUF4181 domain-containing protein [Solibacillus sp.]